MTAYTVETSQQVAHEAQQVAEAFQSTFTEARAAYVENSTTETWHRYTEALDQYQAAAKRATTARRMAEAIAYAEHMTQVWARCKGLNAGEQGMSHIQYAAR